MRQCNSCRNRRCDRIKLHRSGKVELSVKQMQSDCPRHKPLIPWKKKLIVAALSTNPQGVHDVLARHKMQLQELADPPFFKIIHERKLHGGKGSTRKRSHRGKRRTGNAQRAVRHSGHRPSVERSDRNDRKNHQRTGGISERKTG